MKPHSFHQALTRWALFALLVLPQIALAGNYEDFFDALSKNRVTPVARLLDRGFDPNTVGPDGAMALHSAIMEQAFDVAELLVASPLIQVDKPNQHDETPLMLAALRGHLPLCKQLLAKGAKVNKTGWTALHYAASGDNLEVLALLLDHGANPDAPSPSGNTPLMMAVLYGPEAFVVRLLEKGANPLLENNAQRSALDLAIASSRTPVVNRLAKAMTDWKDRTQVNTDTKAP